MTGGQRNDGNITVPQIAAEMAAEGAQARRRRHRRAVEISRRHQVAGRASTIHHRDELQEVQKELRRCRAAPC